MATVTLKLKTGTLPNFIKVDNERGTYVDVCDLTKEEVEAYVRQWGQDFRSHISTRLFTRNRLTKKS